MRDHQAIEQIGARRAEEFQGEVHRERPRSTELERQLAEDQRPTVVDRAALADRQLAEADRRLAAADAALAEADARLRAATEAQREDARTNLHQRLEEYADLLYLGEPSKAAQVMAEIVEPLLSERTAPIDLKTLKSAVKRELKTDEALEAFAQAYPEIVANQPLAAIADRHLEAALAQGNGEAEALEIAGVRTREFIRQSARAMGMRERGARGHRDVETEPSDTRGVIAEMAASRPGAIAARMREPRE